MKYQSVPSHFPIYFFVIQLTLVSLFDLMFYDPVNNFSHGRMLCVEGIFKTPSCLLIICRDQNMRIVPVSVKQLYTQCLHNVITEHIVFAN